MQKIVLITGGTSGIGLATAKLFLTKGDKVIVASRSQSKFKLNLDDSNENLRFIQTDFNNMDSIKNLYSVIQKEYSTIDIAINNVGMAIMKPLIDFEEEDFDFTINVNLKSLWISLKNQIPFMLKDKVNEKHIINFLIVRFLS